MEAFVFPSEEALHVALRSGLVPAAVQRASARVSWAKDGAVCVTPSVSLDATAVRALRAAGVGSELQSAPSQSSDRRADRVVSCWAEALVPRAAREEELARASVLFTLESNASLLAVAGELLRLGCDRQELRVVAGPGALTALIRVADPPWYVLSRAIDHLDGLRAFVPTPAGQERLWTEFGASHPLTDVLGLPSVGMVLICNDGAWWRLPDAEWTDVDHLVETASVGAPSQRQASTSLPRIAVTLKLGRAAKAEASSLFVVRPGPRGTAQQQVEALVRSTPETQLDHALFAVCGELVVLRARPGKEAAMSALPGEPYARVLDLPNLFAPAGQTVEPPLRRDRLRTWLAPDPDFVTWLEPSTNGFGRVSVLEASFRPLSEWVEYVIDGATQQLTAWVRTATFDFDGYTSLEDPAPAPAPSAPSVEPEPKSKSPGSPKRKPESRPAREAPEPPRAALQPLSLTLPSTPSELDALITREEAAFIELDAPAEAPARREGWTRLGELYARAQRPRDAGMAWAHAVWDAPDLEATALARRWWESSSVRLDTVLATQTPNLDQTRGAIAGLLTEALSGSTAHTGRAAEWLAFLDRSDEDLDVRTVWLGRFALARLTGGDALGLARARDRVLTRLQRGLSLDRDVPRLMRVAGQHGGGSNAVGTERVVRVSAQLEALLRAFDETPRKRSPIEAPQALTRAYVQLEFAWGFARLGNADRARQLREQAFAALDRREPVHGCLTNLYGARIDQALEGAQPATPLPPEVNAQYSGLEAQPRYKVDRLRQWSLVLDPHENVNATLGFLSSLSNSKGEALGALRAIREPAELLKAIEVRSHVAADPALAVEERVRLLLGLIALLPELPESHALPMLQKLVSLCDGMAPNFRVGVFGDALKVAGHFGRGQLVKQLVMTMSGLLNELGPEAVAEIGASLVAGVRTLRRVGLRDEAAALLTRAGTVLKGNAPKVVQARLGLASGFSTLGQHELAKPIVEEALSVLSREPELQGADGARLGLIRAVSIALSHAPTEVALTGLVRVANQLSWLTDTFSTNPHFCLSLVSLADALVLGHVGDDLTLNETTRRFLEEDEYLVRRRVHRDVGGDA